MNRKLELQTSINRSIHESTIMKGNVSPLTARICLTSPSPAIRDNFEITSNKFLTRLSSLSWIIKIMKWTKTMYEAERINKMGQMGQK